MSEYYRYFYAQRQRTRVLGPRPVRPSEVPFAVQETAIEVLLQEEPHLASVLEGPAEFAAARSGGNSRQDRGGRSVRRGVQADGRPMGKRQGDPTAASGCAAPLDVNLHPVYRPAILERDAEEPRWRRRLGMWWRPKERRARAFHPVHLSSAVNFGNLYCNAPTPSLQKPLGSSPRLLPDTSSA